MNRRIHKSMRPYLKGHVIGDAEIESFLAHVGDRTTYVADKRFATRANIEWALLSGDIVVAVPERVAATVLLDDGSIKQIENEEIWT